MPSTPSDPTSWWAKLVVSLELADLTDSTTRDKLDSAAAKAHNQGLRTAYQMMHRHAEGLSAERHALFFEAVPLHRAIDAAWEATREK